MVVVVALVVVVVVDVVVISDVAGVDIDVSVVSCPGVRAVDVGGVTRRKIKRTLQS